MVSSNSSVQETRSFHFPLTPVNTTLDQIPEPRSGSAHVEGERLCGSLCAAKDPANPRQATSPRGPQFIYTEKEKENLCTL